MKRTYFKQNYQMVLLILFALAACTQDGEVGPIGPQGPQGRQGEIGPQGDPGEDGEDGNANVIASDWIQQTLTSSTTSRASMIVEDELITEKVLNTAVILLYGAEYDGRGETNSITQLPTTIRNQNYWYSAGAGEIRINAETNDGTTVDIDLIDAFRFVIIPSNSTSGKHSKELIVKDLKIAGVEISNYHHVAEYFGFE